MAKAAAVSAARDMRRFIAFPNAWTEDENPPVPFKEYPLMPLVLARDAKGELTGKANVPLYDTMKRPIIFANAREEAEWLSEHPKEAARIAEAKMEAAPAHDQLGATSDALRATQDRLNGAKAEIAEKDESLAEALAQLASAKAELAAAKAAKQGGDGEKKLDMRTKEGRAAAEAAKAQG